MSPVVSTRRKRLRNSTVSSTIAVGKRACTTLSGTVSQPIDVATQLSHRPSPRKALSDASQAIPSASPPPPPPPTFESRVRESQPEAAIEAPIEASEVATIASNTDESSEDDTFDARFADNFDGIDWDRLKRYMKPVATQKHRKSWIYRHGYRVALLNQNKLTFFVCKHCHQHKIIDAGGSGIFNVSKATSAASSHLGQQIKGHNFTQNGVRTSVKLPGGQKSLAQLFKSGVEVDQTAANELGNFNVQQFRLAAVLWLVDNNHPLREFESEMFKAMIRFANPEAEAALWVSHVSVSTFVMRLFRFLQPKVVATLSTAISKIHISFDGWTTKGGKRGFFGVVAHFANASGVIIDLPIDLPQLRGSHSGERIAEVIQRTLSTYGITPQKLGYFVLDNAASNDTAIAALARLNSFEATHRRLRCGPHTLNLVGQAIIFGKDKDAYDNAADEHKGEETFMAEWRKHRPLGVPMDIINYIKTPQQYELFSEFQRLANRDLPTHKRLKILEPVKPVVTRWNSFYGAFERAAHLHSAYNSYAGYHINAVALADAHATAQGNKRPDAPSWMRSTGLSAADWGVITEYMEALQPLKHATARLEGRGKAGNFGAIYEVIPVFEYLLNELESLVLPYGNVNFNAHAEAPEDHLAINLKAAWRKANEYYAKLDQSPAYYAAVCLHPFYKFYCDNSWRDKAGWLDTANARFQLLWAEYKPVSPQITRLRPPPASSIDEAIAAFVDANTGDSEASLDEFERWKRLEPKWTTEQYMEEGNPVQYWMKLRPKYPNLARLALEIMTIPASSCDCERMFSELGDLLEPKRRAIRSELLAAIQLVRSWVRAGFKLPTCETPEAGSTDDEIVQEYGICGWSAPAN